MRSLHFVLLFTIMSMTSCKLLDSDLAQIKSFEDPLFLGVNELAIECSGNTILSKSDWNTRYQDFLDQYRINEKKVDFEDLKGNRELCGLVKFYQDKELSTDAELYNLYHLLIINLAAEGFDETLAAGESDLPQNYSLLNITQRGVRVFSEIKWLIENRFQSINDIEQRIFNRKGLKGLLFLFTAGKGFNGLSANVLTQDSLEGLISSRVSSIINNDIFFDDFTDPKSFFLPGVITYFSNKYEIPDQDIRSLINNTLDYDLWSGVISPQEILQLDNGNFIWELNKDPENWQLTF